MSGCWPVASGLPLPWAGDRLAPPTLIEHRTDGGYWLTEENCRLSAFSTKSPQLKANHQRRRAKERIERGNHG